MNIDRLGNVGSCQSPSAFVTIEAGRFRDVDALVPTGASHELNAVSIAARVIGQSVPAILGPKFTWLLLDPGLPLLKRQHWLTLEGARARRFRRRAAPAAQA